MGAPASQAPRTAVALAGLACLGLLLTACGGSPGSGSSPPAAGSKAAAARQFSSCMRENGVPSYPDPSPGGEVRIAGSGIDPGSPRFRHAQRACAKYLTGAGKAGSPQAQRKGLAALLAFARCMRAHGVTDFPDPRVSGGTIVQVAPGGKRELNSPAFRQAQRACLGRLPRG